MVGFRLFPGVLWQLYEYSGEMLDAAEEMTSRVEPAKKMTDTHDLGFILMHSTGNLPGNSEIDVPLTYADYYYVEALLRLKKLLEVQVRGEWVDALTKIAYTVLANLAAGTLRENMPFESLSDDPDRRKVSYLEAVGRTVCGIAPWLELGPDDTPEGRLREEYIGLTLKGLQTPLQEY